MFYTDEEISVITGFLNGYLVRDHASAKVRESYIRISAGLQSHTLTRDDYVWLENALLFLRPSTAGMGISSLPRAMPFTIRATWPPAV